jgi:predicted transcriptional regulator
MNKKQKPATRKIKIFKAMSRKGCEEVLGFILQNGEATFSELKSLYKDSTLRIIISLLLKAQLIKARRSKADKRFSAYFIPDENLVINLIEIIN